jgi:signal transduction histidine kinase
VLTLFRSELERRRIRVDVDDPGSVTATVDKNQLEQVLVNVLKNAVESIGADGRVAVSLSDGRDGVRLTIADDGPGIPDTVRARLFTPFFSTKRDGRGIGLTVIAEILTRHGFAFALEPVPDGGAEFRIDFKTARG